MKWTAIFPLLTAVAFSIVDLVTASTDCQDCDTVGSTNFTSAKQSILPKRIHAVPLNEKDFKTWLEKYEYVLVNFYAPWCVWCQRLEPVYEALAERVEVEQLPVSIIKVDCIENRELCMAQKIQAFPNLRLFRHKEAQPPDYQSNRTVDALLDFLKSRLALDEHIKLVKPEEKEAHSEPIAEQKDDHAGSMTSLSPTQAPISTTCSNICIYSRDGVCDDPRGTKYCELGTDCQDCGPVGPTNFTKPKPLPTGCCNTCIFSKDGVCDDPRGSNKCLLGTDCDDCGPVSRYDIPPPVDDDDDGGNTNSGEDRQSSFLHETVLHILFVVVFGSVFAVLCCLTSKIAPKW